MSRSSLLVLVVIIAISLNAAAQSTEKTQPVALSTAAAKSARDAEAERLLKERRANAQSLLINLAADAGTYSDQKLRARTQARIADALWDADVERARTLFRRAWDAAEVVDQEGLRQMQEEAKQQQARNGNSAVTAPPNVRGEVLRLAAKRDRNLGEEFLTKLKVEKAREATEATDRAQATPFDTPEAVRQRLGLARQLLSADVERALQFADPALGTITREGIDFLSYLREKDVAAADRRYAVLLVTAANTMQSDANTVSLLTSYLFTPHVFVTFNGNGASTMQTSRATDPVIVPELRMAFFRAAAGILLRPQAAPGQDQTSAGLDGKYLMIKRLLPLFEQFASKDLADAMRAQLDVLGTTVPEDMRTRDDDTVREGIRPPQSGEDREKSLLDRIDHAKTSEQRDALYLELARTVVESGDMRARDYVEKIEDSELRKQVRAFIDATMIIRALDKKEVDKILELVRTGELTHLQKAWALASTSKLLVKTDREKALAVIEDATAEAKRIDASDPDRPRALMAVANALLVYERGKSWDATYDAIKAANSAEGFTGEDGVLKISLITKNIGSVRTSSAQDFDVSGIFGELTKDDYNRTVELARGFEHEAPRASAVIAIARAILSEKQK